MAGKAEVGLPEGSHRQLHPPAQWSGVQLGASAPGCESAHEPFTGVCKAEGPGQPLGMPVGRV